MANYKNIFILAVALLLILIGTGIYYFFRTSIIAFQWLHVAQNGNVAVADNNPLVYWIVYCLPDALWYMSLLLIQTLFLNEKGWLNRLLVGIALSLPFLLETGQYFGLVSGTFDPLDLITYCFTLILFVCLRKTSLLSPRKLQ